MVEYTRKEKIDAICEARGFTGTDEEKLNFIKNTVVPLVEEELANSRSKLQAQITQLQNELNGLPDTALKLINKRAITLLRMKETKTLTQDVGEL